MTSEDVDPRQRWDRPLPALDQMQVNFEERVDIRLPCRRTADCQQELNEDDPFLTVQPDRSVQASN
jgi:hypothetical protein